MNNINVIIDELKSTNHPSVRASILSKYISQSLLNKCINLYEAYLLNWEKINYEREAYVQPAWNKKVQITNCISILNMKMVAYLLNDQLSVIKLSDWALEAYNMNQEKRSHYIMDNYEIYLHAYNDGMLLTKLLSIRSNKISFNDGPFHSEIFPYEYCLFEEYLINKMFFGDSEKYVSNSVEDLLVEISLLDN